MAWFCLTQAASERATLAVSRLYRQNCCRLTPGMELNVVPTDAVSTKPLICSRLRTASASETPPSRRLVDGIRPLAHRIMLAARAGSLLTSWQILRRSGSSLRSSACKSTSTLGMLGKASWRANNAFSSIDESNRREK